MARSTKWFLMEERERHFAVKEWIRGQKDLCSVLTVSNLKMFRESEEMVIRTHHPEWTPEQVCNKLLRLWQRHVYEIARMNGYREPESARLMNAYREPESARLMNGYREPESARLHTPPSPL